MHALGLEFGSAAQLSKRPGSVWNCLWGNALKRSPGIIRKSRVSYPGPGFLSSATWPMLPKKHYNGLNQNNYVYPQIVTFCIHRCDTHTHFVVYMLFSICSHPLSLFDKLLRIDHCNKYSQRSPQTLIADFDTSLNISSTIVFA